MKYFLVLFLTIHINYGQEFFLGTEQAIQKSMNAIAKTLDALDHKDIWGAINIACQTSVEESCLDWKTYSCFLLCLSNMIDFDLKMKFVVCYTEQAYDYLRRQDRYVQYADVAKIPISTAYELIFCNRDCRNAWYVLNKDLLNKYPAWQKNMDDWHKNQQSKHHC